MHRGSAYITRKGQVTVPMRIRELLGLQQGDRIDFIAEQGRIVMQRGESVIATTAGIVKTGAPVHTAQQLREEAEQAIAEEAERRASP